MAKPVVGATSCGQGPLQGNSWMLPGQARRDDNHLRAQSLAARHPQGQPNIGYPQGLTASRAMPARVAPIEVPPVGAAPTAGAATQ
ncbi:hypothetical protein B296_00024075 [Ensete ventricosum]|uniref:Uncharacterized protein n=1 Tax=Ensete ventricosum TaxID=4639 RepID=A0A426YG07_ENSVE|nr:hypothetical protein B296_00024075 [Ensete ventricosum]